MATVRATVEVFGQRLGLRADGDADRLQEIARFVDSRMREVADRSSSVHSVSDPGPAAIASPGSAPPTASRSTGPVVTKLRPWARPSK